MEALAIAGAGMTRTIMPVTGWDFGATDAAPPATVSNGVTQATATMGGVGALAAISLRPPMFGCS